MPREDLAVRAGLRDLVPVGVNRFCVVVVLGSRGHVPHLGGRRGGGASHRGLRRRRIRVACSARTGEIGACRTASEFRWVSPQRGVAVARGPQIDLLGLPAEQNLQRAADNDACAAPFDALPWRGGTPPAGLGARLLAAPAAHGAAVMTARTVRSAPAVIVAAQPDDLVSVALAHPTVWTVEQVTAAAAAAASTAPPAVLTQLVPVAVAADYLLAARPQEVPSARDRRCATEVTTERTGQPRR